MRGWMVINPDWMTKDGGNGFNDGVDHYEDDIVHEATDNVDYNFENENLR